VPVMGIQASERLSALRPQSHLQSQEAIGGQSFGDILKDTLQDVNRLQIEADVASTQLALGQVDDLHQVTIATEKAYLALQLTTVVRNKVVEAYQEISRMQL